MDGFGFGDASIARANLDGSGVEQTSSTSAVAAAWRLTAAHVYWNSIDSIGRANLDGSGVEENFIGGGGGLRPGGRRDARLLGPLRRSIGRANLDGGGVEPNLITDANGTCGVAVDGAHVYWGRPHSGPMA